MADYYASQSGVGLANGTSADNAWAIGSVNWTTCAGETLYILGTIISTVTVGASGTSATDRTIIRGDYIGQAASLENSGFHGISIDGYSNFEIKNINNISPTSGRGIRLLNAVSNVLIDNVNFTGTATSQGIQYDGNGDDIEIKNCTGTAGFDVISIQTSAASNITNVSIHDNTVNNAGRHAIFCHSDNADTGSITGVDIYNNAINTTGVNTGSGWGNGNGIRVTRESITNGARHSNISVYGNSLSSIGGIGIMSGLSDDVDIYDNTMSEISLNSNGQGIGIYGCTNFKVHSNTIDKVYSSDAVYDGHGIDLDYIQDIVTTSNYFVPTTGKVYSNKIYNAYDATRTPGINLLSTNNIEVTSNIIVNCTHGIKIAKRGGGGTPQVWVNNKIANNTFIGGADGNTTGILISAVNAVSQSDYDTNKFNNNIIKGYTTAIHIEAGDGDLTNCDYNNYYDNTTNETHDGTGAINSTGEITANPLLDPDYYPYINSPCIGAGAWTGQFLKDHGNRPFKKSNPSIGAWEHSNRDAARTRAFRDGTELTTITNLFIPLGSDSLVTLDGLTFNHNGA